LVGGAIIADQQTAGRAVEREVVVLVIGAGLYDLFLQQGLVDDIDAAAHRVPLLGDGGLADTIERAGFAALERAPRIVGKGAAECEQLLTAGRSRHPDVWRRWERARAAAVEAVEEAARQAAGSDSDRVMLADVLAMESRRRQLAQLHMAFGDEG
jgi:hypothetical protein